MVAVFLLDRSKRCSFVNAIAELLTGLPLAQATGQPFADVIWRHTPGRFEDSDLGRVLASGNAGEGETAIVDRGGVRRPLAFRIIPVDLNAPAGATIVELIDLTGETGTGRALRESEQRLRLATEATGIGIWDVNARTGERQWSPEFLAILGLPPETPPSSDLFISMVHPDDRAWLNALYERTYSGPEHGHYSAEFRVIRANDGAERWVATTGRVTFDAEGQPIRGIGTLRDIHERREGEAALQLSEERHRLAIEANEVGTWEYDMVTGEHRWSDQCKALWGLPADVASDPDLVRPLVDPRDWQAVRRKFAEASDPASTGRITAEYQIRRADTGQRRWCSFSGRVLFDEAGKTPVRAIGIMMDTTARKAAEERQRRVLREMHHRVRNSLAVAQAIVSQTLRSNAKGKDSFDRIQSRLMSMARAHDLLNQSDWGEVSLRTLIASELEPLSPARDGRVKLEGEQVLLDSTAALALGVAFHELASNAAKFGALSATDGQLQVTWKVTAGTPSDIEIAWTERGSPARAPANPGLGMRLIRTSVRDSLAGKSDVAFLPDGVHWSFRFPMRAAAEDILRDSEPLH